MTSTANMFRNLSNLKELSININWEMNSTMPDIFKGLKHLEKLDLSNTRFVNTSNLIVSLQGLRNNTNLKVLNLWHINTMKLTKLSNHEFDLRKILEPLSKSNLEELNIGYNAFRSVHPGLLQNAPKLKRLIARNNVLDPIITSTLMIEAVLHQS